MKLLHIISTSREKAWFDIKLGNVIVKKLRWAYKEMEVSGHSLRQSDSIIITPEQIDRIL
ncbi:hypothetical protein ASG14_12260 [Pedobacter sp. Leaf194]|nr:hypothetical protein ASG14_12260 [Pedobacter sp. Leaf194]